MMDQVQEFIRRVSEKSDFQKKYLKNWKVTDAERKELDTLLQFFMEELRYDMNFIVDSYLFINNMVMEETYYFICHDRYRNSTFKDVKKTVYDNPEYMEKYMMGLSISDYVWINHIKMLRYFDMNSCIFSGNRFLEIGPGFGQYTVKALLHCNFSEYRACDISKISVDRGNRYLRFRNLDQRCIIEEEDFFRYNAEVEFDCIVMGEVLEHVEQPMEMLRKTCGVLKKKGKAFVTTVINAPMVDHIFLFRSIDDVLNMAWEAGFSILDYMCTTEREIPLAKAVKRKQAINIAMILEKM